MLKLKKNSKLKKKLKTQGENSKSRHFYDPWVPEKRPKKPEVNAINIEHLPIEETKEVLHNWICKTTM